MNIELVSFFFSQGQCAREDQRKAIFQNFASHTEREKYIIPKLKHFAIPIVMHNFLREERNCCLFSVLLPPRSPEIWFLNLFYSTKTDNRVDSVTLVHCIYKIARKKTKK